jgi:hypothetical protein
LDLNILYRHVTSEGSERLSLLDSRFVHVGQLDLADSQLRSLTFCIRGTTFERCFLDYPLPIRSFLLSVPVVGNYSFPASALGISDQFEDSNGRTVFSLDSKYSFIDVFRFDHFPAPTISPSAEPGSATGVWIGLGVGLGLIAIGIGGIAGILLYRRCAPKNAKEESTLRTPMEL